MNTTAIMNRTQIGRKDFVHSSAGHPDPSSAIVSPSQSVIEISTLRGVHAEQKSRTSGCRTAQSFLSETAARPCFFLMRDGLKPRLVVQQAFEDENPPTHEQGSDKPGRALSGTEPNRSAMEQTDCHDIEKHRFTRTVAGALDRFLSELKAEHVVIVAPPRTLADLGRSLSQTVQDSIVAELAKDLTGLSVSDIRNISPPDHSGFQLLAGAPAAPEPRFHAVPGDVLAAHRRRVVGANVLRHDEPLVVAAGQRAEYRPPAAVK